MNAKTAWRRAWDYGPLNQGERVAIWSRCDSRGHNEIGVWIWQR